MTLKRTFENSNVRPKRSDVRLKRSNVRFNFVTFRLPYGRGLVSQIIEPVTFARCAFIIALRNIALDGYLDTRRNI